MWTSDFSEPLVHNTSASKSLTKGLNDYGKQSEAKKNLVLRNLDMFMWTSGFCNPLAHTHFNMFVDEC